MAFKFVNFCIHHCSLQCGFLIDQLSLDPLASLRKHSLGIDIRLDKKCHVTTPPYAAQSARRHRTGLISICSYYESTVVRNSAAQLRENCTADCKMISNAPPTQFRGMYPTTPGLLDIGSGTYATLPAPPMGQMDRITGYEHVGFQSSELFCIFISLLLSSGQFWWRSR